MLDMLCVGLTGVLSFLYLPTSLFYQEGEQKSRAVRDSCGSDFRRRRHHYSGLQGQHRMSGQSGPDPDGYARVQDERVQGQGDHQGGGEESEEESGRVDISG